MTVSRKWDNPKISIGVSKEGISLAMDMEDFKAALSKEMGSVTWVFSKAEFEKRLKIAIDNIISGIKEESIKVV